MRTIDPGSPQLIWIFDQYVHNPGPVVDLPRGETPAPVTIVRLDLDAGIANVLGSAPFPEAQAATVTADGTVWLSPLRTTEVVFLPAR